MMTFAAPDAGPVSEACGRLSSVLAALWCPLTGPQSIGVCADSSNSSNTYRQAL
jgi:hypothetical protein